MSGQREGSGRFVRLKTDQVRHLQLRAADYMFDRRTISRMQRDDLWEDLTLGAGTKHGLEGLDRHETARRLTRNHLVGLEGEFAVRLWTNERWHSWRDPYSRTDVGEWDVKTVSGGGHHKWLHYPFIREGGAIHVSKGRRYLFVQRIHDELLRILGWAEGWEIVQKLLQVGHNKLPQRWMRPLETEPCHAACFVEPTPSQCAYELLENGLIRLSFMLRPQTGDQLPIFAETIETTPTPPRRTMVGGPVCT